MKWLADRLRFLGAPRRSNTAKPLMAASRSDYRLSETGLHIAAIGDVHGRADLLHQAFASLDELRSDSSGEFVEIYLGDYVDRGPSSCEVLDRLIARRSRWPSIICLEGNHEQLMRNALRSDGDFLAWLDFGGRGTLSSYGVSPASASSDPETARRALLDRLPQEHTEFLSSLHRMHLRAGFGFVHAGVRPGVPLEDQAERDLLWIREPFLSSEADFGSVIVHGHTPVPEPEFRRNRIGIDTGAFQSNTLTCLLLSDAGASILPFR